jgi:hypothetical protein
MCSWCDSSGTVVNNMPSAKATICCITRP